MRCPSCGGALVYVIHDNRRMIYCNRENREYTYSAENKLVEISKPVLNPPTGGSNVQPPKRVRRSK
jgi:hypothetical protein